MNQLIVLDFDLKLGIDLSELASFFNKMEEGEVIAAAFDQMKHYRYHDSK
jgi:hypothetical protein